MLRFFDKDNRDITNELNIPDYCGNPSCLGEPWCSALRGPIVLQNKVRGVTLQQYQVRGVAGKWNKLMKWTFCLLN